jgi:hypothetical protein
MTNTERTGGVAPVVGHLPSKYKAQSSAPNTTKGKGKKENCILTKYCKAKDERNHT